MRVISSATSSIPTISAGCAMDQRRRRHSAISLEELYEKEKRRGQTVRCSRLNSFWNN